MFRRVIALIALTAPALVFAGMQGCSDEPPPENLCNWLEDGNNCYARFSQDIGTQCGFTFTAGSDVFASATGFFQSRDDLSTCVRTTGGQVIFDPPLDLTTFPLTAASVKFLDITGSECGSLSFAGTTNYAVTINFVDRADAGATTTADGGALDDDITGGTFSVAQEPGRNAFDVSCPGGLETHRFNDLQLAHKCANLASFAPQAYLDSFAGTAEVNFGAVQQAEKNGYVRLIVHYPPDDPSAAGAQPKVVEYFNCAIPAPPPPCLDGAKNNDETDIDCGGSCDANCADGLGCIDNDDCQSGNCGLEAGLRQCKAAG